MHIDWNNSNIVSSLVSGMLSLTGTVLIVISSLLSAREATRRADLAKADAERCRKEGARRKRQAKRLGRKTMRWHLHKRIPRKDST